MITVLLHTKDNNTNSREERATTLSTEEKKRERQRHTEKRIGPQKDVAKEISSNRSKHDIHMHTHAERFGQVH